MKCKIVVIGHLVWDRIISGSGRRREDFGGIAYNLAALGAVADPKTVTVFPVCNIGSDLYDRAKSFFCRFPAIDFSMIRKIPGSNIVHELRYDKNSYRRELNIGRMPKISLALIRECRRIDIALVNYIGGDEFPPAYLCQLKKDYRPIIYMDYHSLALGRTPKSGRNWTTRRYFRSNPHWREYTAMADIVQMNFYELQSIFPRTQDDAESIASSATKILITGPRAVIVTREGKDLVVVFGNKAYPGVTVMPVHRVDRIADPTGCGDSFAAGFINDYHISKNIIKACKAGLFLAGRKAAFSGLSGFFEIASQSTNII